MNIMGRSLQTFITSQFIKTHSISLTSSSKVQSMVGTLLGAFPGCYASSLSLIESIVTILHK